MGQFSYECPICGGGEKRCGQNHKYDDGEDCDGGQFCWEDNAYFMWRGKFVKGIYSGYGYVDYNELKIYSQEFSKYFEEWEDVKYTTPIFVCESCFLKNKSKIVNDTTVDSASKSVSFDKQVRILAFRLPPKNYYHSYSIDVTHGQEDREDSVFICYDYDEDDMEYTKNSCLALIKTLNKLYDMSQISILPTKEMLDCPEYLYLKQMVSEYKF